MNLRDLYANIINISNDYQNKIITPSKVINNLENLLYILPREWSEDCSFESLYDLIDKTRKDLLNKNDNDLDFGINIEKIIKDIKWFEAAQKILKEEELIKKTEKEKEYLKALKEQLADYNQNINDVVVYQKYVWLNEYKKENKLFENWLFIDILAKRPYKKENFIIVEDIEKEDKYAVTLDDDKLQICLYKNSIEIMHDNEIWDDYSIKEGY